MPPTPADPAFAERCHRCSRGKARRIRLYGLLSYEVARRTREIGIRTALGAQRREIFRLVLRQGLTLTIFGAIVGITAAIGVTRYLGSLLYGVAATDPLTFVTIAFTIYFPAVVLWLPKHVIPASVGCFKAPGGPGYICPK